VHPLASGHVEFERRQLIGNRARASRCGGRIGNGRWRACVWPSWARRTLRRSLVAMAETRSRNSPRRHVKSTGGTSYS